MQSDVPPHFIRRFIVGHLCSLFDERAAAFTWGCVLFAMLTVICVGLNLGDAFYNHFGIQLGISKHSLGDFLVLTCRVALIGTVSTGVIALIAADLPYRVFALAAILAALVAASIPNDGTLFVL